MVVLTGPLRRVDRVAISPEGEYVAAAGGTEQRLVVWAICDPDRPRHILPVGFRERMWNFRFVPASGLLVVGDNAGVTARDPDTAAEVWRIPGYRSGEDGVSGLDVSPDGRELIAAFWDYFGSERIQRWALNGRRPPTRSRGARTPQDNCCRGLAFLPGTSAFVAADDHYLPGRFVDAIRIVVETRAHLRVVNGASRVTHTLETEFASVHQLAVSRTGRFVAAQFRSAVLVWDVEALDAPPQRIRPPRRTAFTGLAFDPSGRYLAVTGTDGALSLYDTTTWQVARTHRWGAKPLWSVGYSEGGSRIAAGSEAGKVVVRDVKE